jgi:hypothetical protein
VAFYTVLPFSATTIAVLKRLPLLVLNRWLEASLPMLTWLTSIPDTYRRYASARSEQASVDLKHQIYASTWRRGEKKATSGLPSLPGGTTKLLWCS